MISLMETQGKKPPSNKAHDSELETVEVTTGTINVPDGGNAEDQIELDWPVDDGDVMEDPADAEGTPTQPDAHAPVTDEEIELLKDRARLAGNSVRHQVQEARAHTVLGKLWQKLALESKPDLDGKFHPSRFKLGSWLGLAACIGFALVLATVLAPTPTAKKPCLPGEVVAVDGAPCEPATVADTTNTVGTNGETQQRAAQTPETAVVDAPALPKSTINGDPLPNPEPAPTPTTRMRPQTEAVAPPATADVSSATALESGATMSPGGPMGRNYSATEQGAPYLAGPQAIAPLPSSVRTPARPARARTYVLSSRRQARAVSVMLKSVSSAPMDRSRDLSSAGEPPAQLGGASSSIVASETPQGGANPGSGGRDETGAAPETQMRSSVLLTAAGSSEVVSTRDRALASDARASETQARSANVGGGGNPATTPTRTVALGASQNAASANGPGPEVAQAGLGQDTYPIGSQVQAKLRFGFLAVEGHDDIPVVAESADGSVWLGWASINKESRVEILFREVYIKGKSYLTGAQAYNLEKLPGLNGTTRYETPNLVADLLQAAVGGISSYVSDLTQRGTTTTSPNSVTTSRDSGPTLGQTVLGRTANLFDIGKDTRALIRLVEVPAETPFLVIVLPKR